MLQINSKYQINIKSFSFSYFITMESIQEAEEQLSKLLFYASMNFKLFIASCYFGKLHNLLYFATKYKISCHPLLHQTSSLGFSLTSRCSPHFLRHC